MNNFAPKINSIKDDDDDTMADRLQDFLIAMPMVHIIESHDEHLVNLNMYPYKKNT